MSPDPTDKVIVEPLTGPVLARAIDRLAVIDPDIQAAVTRIGYPISRLRPKGFATLLRIMVSQQVSTHAAAAIWGRLEAAMDDGATPERFLALDDAARKMEYGRGLAQAITGGSLDLEGLGSLSEDDAIIELCKLRGFGRWSAEIYLLFALSRADSWPADDLAVQIGMQRLKNLEARPDRKTMDRLAEPWLPSFSGMFMGRQPWTARAFPERIAPARQKADLHQLD